MTLDPSDLALTCPLSWLPHAPRQVLADSPRLGCGYANSASGTTRASLGDDLPVPHNQAQILRRSDAASLACLDISKHCHRLSQYCWQQYTSSLWNAGGFCAHAHQMPCNPPNAPRQVLWAPALTWPARISWLPASFLQHTGPSTKCCPCLQNLVLSPPALVRSTAAVEGKSYLALPACQPGMAATLSSAKMLALLVRPPRAR
jgi:hypothetical protein